MKKTKSKPSKEIVPYVDRAAAMNKKTGAKEIDEILKAYESVEAETDVMKSSSVKAANGCRKVGILLQTLCGHEQISFQFWQNNCAKLAAKFDYDNAKIFIAIARRMPDPAKTIADAAPVTQLIFQSVGLLELAERTEEHNAAPVGVFQRFLSNVTVIRQLWKKALREKPVTEWGEMERESFLNETQWIADERMEIEKLKGEV